jgi:predicted transcriptional regulator
MTDIELRDKDQVVLHCLDEGKDDVQKITEATTLENHHVTYAFQKLEDMDLIQVSKPDEMVERTINGQKRVFQHPKTAELTDKGEQYLEETENEDLDEYENLSHKELVERVHELEHRINKIDKKFETFRKQVQTMISE